MTENELVSWIKQLIKEDKLYKFYKSKEFIAVREDVLKDFHFECQECLKKRPKQYTRADTVHHVQFVRKHPELALSRYYAYKGKCYLQLKPVCKQCHNKLHPEKRNGHRSKNKTNDVKKYYNKERFD